MSEGATRETPRHPMGVVVQRTGLTSHVLRAWERRYGAVEPGRTEGGQRLYSDADVMRLRLLKRATESGRAIGQVAGLPTEELAVLVGEDGAADRSSAADGGVRGAEEHLRACLDAAERMDAAELRGELMRAVVKLSVPEFVDGIVGPLLRRVGDLWESGGLRPAQEHVVSTAVRQVLDWLLSRFEPGPRAPSVVVGTLTGELHEFGAMLAAVVAADAGWRVLYLGPSLPPDEIANAVFRTRAVAVAVSVVDGEEEDVDRAGRELRELQELLPEGTLLVAGGRRSAEVTPEGVTQASDLNALREVLSAVRPAGPSA